MGGKEQCRGCFWRRWTKGRGEGHFKVHLLYIQIIFLPSVKHFGFDKFTLNELTQRELWLSLDSNWSNFLAVPEEQTYCSKHWLLLVSWTCTGSGCKFMRRHALVIKSTRSCSTQSTIILWNNMRDPLFQLLPSTHPVYKIFRWLLELAGNTKYTSMETGYRNEVIVQVMLWLS